jgi:hypothetical protein
MKQVLKMRRVILFLLATLIYLTACDKENETPPPVQSERQLRINFSNSTINIADVDSAEVILTKTGFPAITKKLQKANGFMFAVAADIIDGNWQAEWLLYTKKPATGYARQFSRTSLVMFPLSGTWAEMAPAGDWSSGWNPRVLAHDEEAKITYITAMHFSDPYFAIINKSNLALRYVYIDRIASKVNNGQSNVVGAKEFELFNGIPMDGITDRQAFLPLTTEMQGKTWNQGEILIEILDGQNLNRTFYFKYSK